MNLTALEFFDCLRWIDGTPLKARLEPYRRKIFGDVLDTREEDGRLKYNLALLGRAKKNYKSCDLVLASLYALLSNSPAGNQVYLLANDEDQAGDNLSLAKKLLDANPPLLKAVHVREKTLLRKDRKGFLKILPAEDVKGQHGRTFRLCAFDEIHAYRDWDLLEAMQLDPTRLDAQMWMTSYASIYHRPGVPLFDLTRTGRAGTDARMYFSWYAADFSTDESLKEADPETRANPSRASWADQGYLDQQRSRLPAHKFRRLHLNLPGLPAGSAFSVEKVMEAVERGVLGRVPQRGVTYSAFVDMSGGSNDDAVLAVGYLDADGRALLARIVNQGPPPPFDPQGAVERFVTVLREYGVFKVTGDRYAGETFRAAFEKLGITYTACPVPTSKLYESFEVYLNQRQAVLLDTPEVEQQLLGLVWRGGKIDHVPGEHDDWANAAVGLCVTLATPAPRAYMVNFITGDLIHDECR